jgi:hypothetical protein
MPWIIPSHQAPAFVLKRWRPDWFSGLGLVLGTLVPDLEFIVPLRKGTVISHTVSGQLLFTVPIAIVLYVVTCDLVWPWLSPNLSPPWRDWSPVRRASGSQLWRVAWSALIGGLTHIALDGFTHPVSDYGWAVALLPPLQWSVRSPFGVIPIYDILQNVLSLALGIAALRMAPSVMRQERSSTFRGESPVTLPRPSGPALTSWLVAWGGFGAVVALVLRRMDADALSFAAYGILDGAALGILVAAAVSRLRRMPRPTFLASLLARAPM